jgi:hypothetical protein
MRNRVLLLLAAVAATGLMPLAAASAAQAAPATTTVQHANSPNALPESPPAAIPANTLCPAGWFCVWHGPPRVGGWLGGHTHNVCVTPFHNDGNAVSNQTGVTIRVFGTYGCAGPPYFDLATGHFSYPTPFIVHSVLEH